MMGFQSPAEGAIRLLHATAEQRNKNFLKITNVLYIKLTLFVLSMSIARKPSGVALLTIFLLKSQLNFGELKF